MATSVRPVEFEEVGSFSDFIRSVADKYEGMDHVLFRGHQVSSWSLTPRIARTNFRMRFDHSRLKAEKSILDEFERLAVPFVAPRRLESRWDLLALAQHHGLPTRLLDWTSNPLVALWFAVEKPAVDGGPAAVWALSTTEDDIVDLNTSQPDGLDRTMIFRPRHHDVRIAAQAGWFTVHKYSESTQRYSTFERVKGQRERLKKFEIAAERLPEIRDQLARCGITRAALFPDLAGLCAHLTWKYEKLEDENGYDIRVSL